MPKWSIRDLWGKATQKKELKPEVRSMLLDLDGVYAPRQSDDGGRSDEQQTEDARRETAG